MTTKMICLDASFILRYLTSKNTDSIYQQYWNQWQAEEILITAPTLIMYEICNAFHRAAYSGQITKDEGNKLLETALNLGFRFYGDAELHKQALKIASDYNLPATYDAHYLALAQRLNIELWTADQRLFNSVNSSLHWVKFVRE